MPKDISSSFFPPSESVIIVMESYAVIKNSAPMNLFLLYLKTNGNSTGKSVLFLDKKIKKFFIFM